MPVGCPGIRACSVVAGSAAALQCAVCRLWQAQHLQKFMLWFCGIRDMLLRGRGKGGGGEGGGEQGWAHRGKPLQHVHQHRYAGEDVASHPGEPCWA